MGFSYLPGGPPLVFSAYIPRNNRLNDVIKLDNTRGCSANLMPVLRVPSRQSHVVSLQLSVSSCQSPAPGRDPQERQGPHRRDGQGKLSGIVERIVEIGRPSLCSNGKSPASEGGLFFFYPKFRIADWKGKAANFVGVVRLGSGAESARVTLVKRSGVDSSWGEPLE